MKFNVAFVRSPANGVAQVRIIGRIHPVIFRARKSPDIFYGQIHISLASNNGATIWGAIKRSAREMVGSVRVYHFFSSR